MRKAADSQGESDTAVKSNSVRRASIGSGGAGASCGLYSIH